eukprot:2534642-Prymnesium_polylepis.1
MFTIIASDSGTSALADALRTSLDAASYTVSLSSQPVPNAQRVAVCYKGDMLGMVLSVTSAEADEGTEEDESPPVVRIDSSVLDTLQNSQFSNVRRQSAYDRRGVHLGHCRRYHGRVPDRRAAAD